MAIFGIRMRRRSSFGCAGAAPDVSYSSSDLPRDFAPTLEPTATSPSAPPAKGGFPSPLYTPPPGPTKKPKKVFLSLDNLAMFPQPVPAAAHTPPPPVFNVELLARPWPASIAAGRRACCDHLAETPGRGQAVALPDAASPSSPPASMRGSRPSRDAPGRGAEDRWKALIDEIDLVAVPESSTWISPEARGEDVPEVLQDAGTARSGNERPQQLLVTPTLSPRAPRPGDIQFDSSSPSYPFPRIAQSDGRILDDPNTGFMPTDSTLSPLTVATPLHSLPLPPSPKLQEKRPSSFLYSPELASGHHTDPSRSGSLPASLTFKAAYLGDGGFHAASTALTPGRPSIRRTPPVDFTQYRTASLPELRQAAMGASTVAFRRAEAEKRRKVAEAEESREQVDALLADCEERWMALKKMEKKASADLEERRRASSHASTNSAPTPRKVSVFARGAENLANLGRRASSLTNAFSGTSHLRRSKKASHSPPTQPIAQAVRAAPDFSSFAMSSPVATLVPGTPPRRPSTFNTTSAMPASHRGPSAATSHVMSSSDPRAPQTVSPPLPPADGLPPPPVPAGAPQPAGTRLMAAGHSKNKGFRVPVPQWRPEVAPTALALTDAPASSGLVPPHQHNPAHSHPPVTEPALVTPQWPQSAGAVLPIAAESSGTELLGLYLRRRPSSTSQLVSPPASALVAEQDTAKAARRQSLQPLTSPSTGQRQSQPAGTDLDVPVPRRAAGSRSPAPPAAPSTQSLGPSQPWAGHTTLESVRPGASREMSTDGDSNGCDDTGRTDALPSQRRLSFELPIRPSRSPVGPERRQLVEEAWGEVTGVKRWKPTARPCVEGVVRLPGGRVGLKVP